jgi:hypothetical protein
MQKRVVRSMSNAKNRRSCRELFKELRILPMPCVYIMELIIYIKTSNGGLKQNLAVHQHETHHRSDFQLRFCRTNIYKKSVTNLGAKIYNKLPNYIKNQENPRSFKKQLKTFLLHQTFYSVDEYRSYNWDIKILL